MMMLYTTQRSIRRFARRSLIVLAAGGFSVLGSAAVSLAAGNLPTDSTRKLIAYEYPENIVDTYLNACGGEGTDAIPQPVMQEICICTIEEFQTAYSLDEFRTIGQALSKNEPLPDSMEQIMTNCAGKVMLRSYV
jgi:hypothetical protein